MKITIHRGAREIGGSCVEIAAESGSRLLVDLGMPLARVDGSEWPRGTALRPGHDCGRRLLPELCGLYAGKSIVEGLCSLTPTDHYGWPKYLPQIPAFGSRGTLDSGASGSSFRMQPSRLISEN